jgi:hypothetical protein
MFNQATVKRKKINKEVNMKVRVVSFFLAILFITNIASADTHVNGYTRKDGTYVQPHYRSDANNSVYDNYSTKGNANPYTGKEGTVNPYNNYKTNSDNLYGNSYGTKQNTNDGYGN